MSDAEVVEGYGGWDDGESQGLTWPDYLRTFSRDSGCTGMSMVLSHWIIIPIQYKCVVSPLNRVINQLTN